MKIEERYYQTIQQNICSSVPIRDGFPNLTKPMPIKLRCVPSNWHHPDVHARRNGTSKWRRRWAWRYPYTSARWMYFALPNTHQHRHLTSNRKRSSASVPEMWCLPHSRRNPVFDYSCLRDADPRIDRCLDWLSNRTLSLRRAIEVPWRIRPSHSRNRFVHDRRHETTRALFDKKRKSTKDDVASRPSKN